MKFLMITGGAGFIGSHLTQKALSEGLGVICVDNFNNTYDPFVKWERIAAFRNHPNFRLYSLDIRNGAALEQLMDEYPIDTVVHLAALAGVRPSVTDPAAYIDTNIRGTLSILDSMRNKGVRKLLFASSSSVYGNSPNAPFKESDTALAPISPYAITKLTDEMLCANYSELYGLNIFSMRFFTVYGPGQRPEMAISLFLNNILQGIPIRVFGDGRSVRDYTYIKDITEGIFSALPYINGFQVFNLGSGRTISLNELIETIETVTGRKAIREYFPEQRGDVRATFADITKARNCFGYEPSTLLADGINNMLIYRSLRTELPSGITAE
ncbi:MAG: hypothetical protein ABS46_15330 [Cytophagaceae bacterium SCN 52-12]|nr:MAG: hypothetical protein ABS46_15330 [Cytophagaceae bacterium SCN 52-12]